MHLSRLNRLGAHFDQLKIPRGMLLGPPILGYGLPYTGLQSHQI